MSEIKELTNVLEKTLTNTKPLIITDTVARTGIDAFCIYAQADTTFTTLQLSVDSASNAYAGLTMSKGEYWYVHLVGTIKLATGVVFVYQNENSSN